MKKSMTKIALAISILGMGALSCTVFAKQNTAAACKGIYPGKVFNEKSSGVLGIPTTNRIKVLGVDKETGDVSAEITFGSTGNKENREDTCSHVKEGFAQGILY